RQRVNDKFSYRVKNLGITACVGCGRCIRVCPVNLDITAVVKGALEVKI
ncbi:MAG: 4Fe-4S dicluster domain-containing protein, partial [Deltaproteobacteria bacterium]